MSVDDGTYFDAKDVTILLTDEASYIIKSTIGDGFKVADISIHSDGTFIVGFVGTESAIILNTSKHFLGVFVPEVNNASNTSTAD